MPSPGESTPGGLTGEPLPGAAGAADVSVAFQALMGSAPVPMWVFDRETFRFLAVNDKAIQVYGWSRDEFLARTLRDIRPPEDLPRLEAVLAQPASRQRISEGWRHLTRDGRILDVEIHSHPVAWVGRPATLVMALDISDRLHTARALRASERHFRLLAEHSRDLIALHDATGQFIYASPAARQLLGHDPGDLLERDLWHLVYAEDLAHVRAAFQRLMAAEPTPSVAYRAHRADGEVVWLETTGRAIEEAGEDDRARFITVTRDITERRRLEEQLHRSQKLEGIGRLAGGIAHDFNNLLTAILGHAEMAAASLASGAPGRDDLDEVRRAAERAAGLTRQLLAFARRQRIAPRLVDLGGLVRGMEVMLRRLLGEHLELAIETPAGLWAVRADPTQLEQVLLNLAVNARDAMPGGGCLEIAVRNTRVRDGDPRTGVAGPTGECVELVVADTGVGMGPDVLPLIFEPFYTTKEVGRGTGLGLATTYGIVKQSGGHITVQSTPGQGATFTVVLPRATEVEEADAPAPRSHPAVGGEQVLVVEDDDQLRALTARTLRRLGYRVHAAEDGVAALEVADTIPGDLDLLVTDIVMPRMGGLALAEELRRRRPGLRVLYVSGYASEWADGGHDLSEAELVLKPWTADELRYRVRQRLDAPA